MGEHHTLLGSEILLEEARDVNDPSRRYIQPLGLTSQRIRFQEVNVRTPDDEREAENKEERSAEAGPNEAMNKYRMRGSRGRGESKRPKERGRGKGCGGGRGRKKRKRDEDEDVESGESAG